MCLPKYDKTTRQLMEFNSRVNFLKFYKTSLQQVKCKKQKTLYDNCLISFYTKKIQRIKNLM
jgi:hypothetical protein